MMDYAIIFITVPSKEEAQKIAHALLNEKQAACVNIIPAVDSWYWWEGKIDHSSELLLIVKTTGKQVAGIIQKVGKIHPYEVPEVIVVPIDDGNPDYLQWIHNSVTCAKPSSKT
ncbi:MAG: divalent cation tolerance protein CutA [Elusimicrobia bacterium]|nr:divalent cation tolerance protein CutA [Elusimicrobiota bacterium]MBD3412534.1 divalent cation tolerance protein CutA [Elusimicrobiota bacterium]